MGDSSNKSRYVLIDGQKVYLSYREQQAWFKMINDVRNEAKRTNSCGQPDFRLCSGDCGTCPWQMGGLLLSLNDDQSSNYEKLGVVGGLKPVQSVQTPEEILNEHDTQEKVFSYARDAFPQGDRILDLSINSGLSSYKIAELIGQTQSTVARRLKLMLQYIREHRDEFFG